MSICIQTLIFKKAYQSYSARITPSLFLLAITYVTQNTTVYIELYFTIHYNCIKRNYQTRYIMLCPSNYTMSNVVCNTAVIASTPTTPKAVSRRSTSSHTFDVRLHSPANSNGRALATACSKSVYYRCCCSCCKLLTSAAQSTQRCHTSASRSLVDATSPLMRVASAERACRALCLATT